MWLILSLIALLSRSCLAVEWDTPYIPDSDRDKHTLRNDLELQTDGNYHYAYETSNGIAATESGLGGVAVQGGSSYTAPDGQVISVNYVADETGYHPTGDHIPKVPDYILRSLEYIRNHPYQVRDYYTGQLKTVEHDNAAFDLYSRNFAEASTPRPSRPRSTPETIYLTRAPPSEGRRQRRHQRQSRGNVRYLRRR